MACCWGVVVTKGILGQTGTSSGLAPLLLACFHSGQCNSNSSPIDPAAGPRRRPSCRYCRLAEGAWDPGRVEGGLRSCGRGRPHRNPLRYQESYMSSGSPYGFGASWGPSIAIHSNQWQSTSLSLFLSIYIYIYIYLYVYTNDMYMYIYNIYIYIYFAGWLACLLARLLTRSLPGLWGCWLGMLACLLLLAYLLACLLAGWLAGWPACLAYLLARLLAGMVACLSWLLAC